MVHGRPRGRKSAEASQATFGFPEEHTVQQKSTAAPTSLATDRRGRRRSHSSPGPQALPRKKSWSCGFKVLGALCGVVVIAVYYFKLTSSFLDQRADVKPPQQSTKTDDNKLCIVIPYRDGCLQSSNGQGRKEQLEILLSELPAHIQRSNPAHSPLNYDIIVSEQVMSGRFNKGVLLNVGFEYGARELKCTYFVFHDVDIIPEHVENTYRNIADKGPVFLASAMSRFDYKENPANTDYLFVGGALMITASDYARANGHSNAFVGWGLEDDNFAGRLEHANLTLQRLPVNIGRYRNLIHSRHVDNFEQKRDPNLPSSANLFHMVEGRSWNHLLQSWQVQNFGRGRLFEAQQRFRHLIPQKGLAEKIGVPRANEDGLSSMATDARLVKVELQPMPAGCSVPNLTQYKLLVEVIRPGYPQDC